MYPYLTKCTDVYHRWTPIASGGRIPSPDEKQLMDLVQKAIDAGLFYNRDVDAYVKEHADFIPSEAWTLQDGVEGGVMGYEVFHVRDALEKIATRKENEEAVKLYHVGQKLGTLYVNTKRMTGAEIEKIEGITVWLLAKAGSNTYRLWINARAIKPAKERAIARGWCKS